MVYYMMLPLNSLKDVIFGGRNHQNPLRNMAPPSEFYKPIFPVNSKTSQQNKSYSEVTHPYSRMEDNILSPLMYFMPIRYFNVAANRQYIQDKRKERLSLGKKDFLEEYSCGTGRRVFKGIHLCVC